MCVCYLGTMGDLWLIPVHDGLRAVQQALDDPSQELAAVAVRYVLTSGALLRYAVELSGVPSRN